MLWQTVEWWERAAVEEMNLGLDPAQALRLFMKADAAAEALAAHLPHRTTRLADSALSIGQMTGGKWPGVLQIHASASVTE